MRANPPAPTRKFEVRDIEGHRWQRCDYPECIMLATKSVGYFWAHKPFNCTDDGPNFTLCCDHHLEWAKKEHGR